jgi:DNA uptake protein ComE-like DNA-binding protein
VAAAAALVLSADPKLPATQVVDLLKSSARPLGQEVEPLWDQMGAGVVDIGEAVRRARAGVDPNLPPVPPEPEPAYPLNVNLADEKTLITVPSMSEQRARTIVADRRAQGPYATLWDLRRTGIFTAYIIGWWLRENYLTV